MNSAVVAGIVRHILTAAAGVLVTLGTISEDVATQIVVAGTGLVSAIIGIIWSAKAPEKKEVK